MASKYYDDSTSTISPQLMKSIQDTNTNNAGTHIAKLFDDLGNVQEYKYKKQEEAQDKAVTREIAGINLEAIKQEVADKRNASKAMFENKPLSELGLEVKNPQYLSLVDDYLNKKKTLLSETEIKNTMAEATTKFTDENGFRYNDAVAHLKRKVDNGELSLETFAGTLDAVNKTQKRGIYEEQLSEKDRLGLMKTQLQIKKLSHDINNPDRGNGGLTNEIKNWRAYAEAAKARGEVPIDFDKYMNANVLNKNNEIEKAKEKYNILLKGGGIPEGQIFEQWYAQSGGDVKLKTEGITTAKNNLTKQFTGLEQINQLLLDKYTPSDVGVVDGAIQGLREFTNLHNSRSGEIESDRNGLTMALTKALAGGNASNKDLAKAESIIGGAFQTESGASSKYKAALNQSIIAIGETINQLENAGYDPKNERARLNEMIDFSQSINGWDGSTTIQDFLGKKESSNNTGTKVLRKRDNTQSTQGNTTINNVEDFDKLLGL